MTRLQRNYHVSLDPDFLEQFITWVKSDFCHNIVQNKNLSEYWQKKRAARDLFPPRSPHWVWSTRAESLNPHTQWCARTGRFAIAVSLAS